MLAKSAYLGAFESCSTLHFVDKDKRLAKTKILKGDCLFSNGQAQVIFFLFNTEGKVQLTQFMVIAKT